MSGLPRWPPRIAGWKTFVSGLSWGENVVRIGFSARFSGEFSRPHDHSRNVLGEAPAVHRRLQQQRWTRRVSEASADNSKRAPNEWPIKAGGSGRPAIAEA